MTPPIVIEISSDEEDEVIPHMASKTQAHQSLGASNELQGHQRSVSDDAVATVPHTTQNTARPRAKSVEAAILNQETICTKRALSLPPSGVSKSSRVKEPVIVRGSEKPVSELEPPERSFNLSRNKVSELTNNWEQEELARSAAQASRKRKPVDTTVGPVKKRKTAPTSAAAASTSSAASQPVPEITITTPSPDSTAQQADPLSPAFTPRPRSRPWTCAQIGNFISELRASFDFAGFAEENHKTPAEVSDVFSAVVFNPLFEFSSRGLARVKQMKAFRAKLQEYKKQKREVIATSKKETKAMEKAEAKAKAKAEGKDKDKGKGKGKGKGKAKDSEADDDEKGKGEGKAKDNEAEDAAVDEDDMEEA